MTELQTRLNDDEHIPFRDCPKAVRAKANCESVGIEV